MIGQRVKEFQVLDEVRSGGEGTIYRAYDTNANRDVVIKVLSAQMRETFNVDADKVSQLEHANIVPLYAYWQDDNSTYLVLRYIGGSNLRDLMTQQGALPAGSVIRLLRQIADALDVAHEQGIVHGNIKPENILIDGRGNAYLTDFGLSVENTNTLYLSPEQLTKTPRTAKSDVYALGVLIYEMLIGQHPFAGKQRSVDAVVPDVRDLRPDLSVEFSAIVKRATATNPDERYSSTIDLIADLSVAVQNEYKNTDFKETLKKTPQETVDDRNRVIMLQNIYQFWIEGIFQNSLAHSLIQLNLMTNTSNVERSWEALLRTTNAEQKARILETDSLIDVFDKANGKLLILGAPGCGKTTTLLELLEQLLIRAANDPQYTIPVVVNLSIWSQLMQPIAPWLEEQLIKQYYVPAETAREWIETERLTLLLDGLDEVEENKRKQCVNAINKFRQGHGFTDIIVTSRTTEYLELTDQLMMNAVIQIQPLDDNTIFSYVNAFDPAIMGGLQKALKEDSALLDLARTPFILVILTIAYENMSQEDISQFDTDDARRDHLFTVFTERMLELNGQAVPFNKEVFIDYLEYVAGQMVRYSMTTFAIDDPQPFWLNDGKKISVINRSTTLFFGFLSLLVVLAFLTIDTSLVAVTLAIAIAGAYFVDIGAQGITFGETFKFSLSLIEIGMLAVVVAFIAIVITIPEAILVAMLGVLLLGFKPTEDVVIQRHILPGDSIRKSLTTSLQVFGIVFAIVVLVAGFLFNPIMGILTALYTGLVVTFTRTNVRGILLMLTLRNFLKSKDKLPMSIKKLMESGVDVLFVRRAGSKYIFTHRYILEFFAARADLNVD